MQAGPLGQSLPCARPGRRPGRVRFTTGDRDLGVPPTLRRVPCVTQTAWLGRLGEHIRVLALIVDNTPLDAALAGAGPNSEEAGDFC